mgnify:FL=1
MICLKISYRTRVSLGDQDGAALVTVLTVVVVLMVLAGAVSALATSSRIQALRQKNRVQAYFIARSGAEALVSYIVDNPQNLTIGEKMTFLEQLVDKGNSQETAFATGSFTLSVSKMGAAEYAVTSVGKAGRVTQTVTYTIRALQPDPVDMAIFGDGPITIENNAEIDGDIITNSTAEGAVKIGKAKIMDCTIKTGPTETPNKVVSTSITPKPPIVSLDSAREYPNPLPIAWPTEPDLAYGNLTIPKNAKWTIIAPAGTTKVITVDDLILKNKATLTIDGTGTVLLYAKSIDFINNTEVNKDGEPDQLRIWCESLAALNNSVIKAHIHVDDSSVELKNNVTMEGNLVVRKEGATVDIDNNCKTQGIVYAPNCSVIVHPNVEVEGAIIAGTVTIWNNAKVEGPNWDDDDCVTLTHTPLASGAVGGVADLKWGIWK